MSYAFLITSVPEEGFKVEIASFIDQLKSQWPDAVIQRKEQIDQYEALVWDLQIENYPMTGRLTGQQNTVSLDASLPYAAKFAAWYRSIVPSQHKLLFFDASGETAPIEIGIGMTDQQIIEAYSSPSANVGSDAPP